jgi:hypothetical protein
MAAQPGAQGGQHSFSGQEGYPPVAGGFAGPAAAQPPYPDYQAWQGQGAPGGYAGPGGYGAMVNGGDYAHVIRQDGAASPAQPDAPGRGQGEWPGHPAAPGGQAPASSSAAAATPAGPARAGRVRAITSGTAGTGWPAVADERQEAASPEARSSAAGPAAPAAPAGPAIQADAAATAGTRPRAEAAPEIDPALAYGPDDPAYGPPGPDWYKRGAEGAPPTVDVEATATASEPQPSRGPFEPLRLGEREGAGQAGYQQADGETTFDAPDTLDAPDTGPLESEISEMSELLDLGTPTDPEAGSLGQIRDLYQAAETVSQVTLDRHFDQILERQRELISEYFTESVGLGFDSTEAEEAAPVASPAPADASSPFGFDSAQSLTGLRGELRSAQ